MMAKRALVLIGVCLVALAMPWSAPVDDGPGFSFSWTAEKDLELFGREAELVRATYEAGFHYLEYRVEYPGYLPAVRAGDGARTHLVEGRFRGVPVNGSLRAVTVNAHVAELAAVDGEISAVVCNYFQSSLQERRVSPEEDGYGIFPNPIRVRLRNLGGERGNPGIADESAQLPDRRAGRPPAWNVFGDWEIVELRKVEGADALVQCLDWWESISPGYIAPTELGAHPALSASFVLEPVPVAAQYPEWIGPTESG